MPDLRLSDLGGKKQSLSELLGGKLTVVLFWRAAHPYDLEELSDLAADVAAPYSERGVNVVAINEDESRDEARAVVERLGITFPVLLDPEGKALAKVAVGKLPRTYLLDPSGKVIWFDLHYTRSTRRDLLRAVRFTLGEQ
jgi:peroxiredoxin